MAFAFTRTQLLEEADRYLQNAAALPDSDPGKPVWIEAASNLSNAVLARIYHQLALSDYEIPDDLEH
jgi:hypothetical protein